MTRKRTFVCVVLAVIAILSIAANVFLFSRLRTRYADQLAQQIWPIGTVSPPLTAKSSDSNGEIILLTGDSRIAEWGLPALTNGNVVNAGQPGATTAQIRLRLPALLDRLHPAIVVIQAGINDLKLIGIRPELGPTLVAESVDNISNMVVQCSQHHCRVIVLETWPTGKPEIFRRVVWNDQIAEGVARLNEALRRMHSPTNGVWVVDLFKETGISPDPENYRDALHFQPAVYRRLTQALSRELTETRKESN